MTIKSTSLKFKSIPCRIMWFSVYYQNMRSKEEGMEIFFFLQTGMEKGSP